MKNKKMQEIILKTLNEIACKNTGTCQINLQSLSAQEMIANKLVEQLDPFFKNIVEEIVTGVPSYEHEREKI